MIERGSASVFVLAIVVCGLILAAGLVAVGQLVGARASAINAADAAALAAAPVTFRDFGSGGSPIDEARRFAEANGAALLHCACPRNTTYATRTVEVEVAVVVDVVGLYRADVTASSAAEFRPVALLTGE